MPSDTPPNEEDMRYEFVIDAYLEGKEEGSTGPWGFSIEQPFAEDFVYEIKNFFIGSRIRNFARQVGKYSENKGKAILLIGPDGIGKTTLVRKFVEILGNATPSIRATYRRICKQASTLGTQPNDEDLLISTAGFEGAIRRIDIAETEIFILDDADILCGDIPRILDEISQNIETHHINILIISPSTYKWLVKNDSDVLRQYILRLIEMEPYEKEDIIELLKRRIEYFKDENGLYPFTQESLEKIADHSLGLPRLALKLADGCFLDFKGIDEIDKEDVDRQAKEQNFVTAKKIAEGNEEYWGGTTGEVLAELAISLSPIEQQEKLTEKEGTSSAELVERVSPSSQSTTSYHLKKLVKGGIVRTKKVGRNQIYTLSTPIRNAVELALMSGKYLQIG
ncbi:MAG: helix-turn-helix domain-containing protein [Promethearchaeota archaeon]